MFLCISGRQQLMPPATNCSQTTLPGLTFSFNLKDDHMQHGSKCGEMHQLEFFTCGGMYLHCYNMKWKQSFIIIQVMRVFFTLLNTSRWKMESVVLVLAAETSACCFALRPSRIILTWAIKDDDTALPSSVWLNGPIKHTLSLKIFSTHNLSSVYQVLCIIIINICLFEFHKHHDQMR